MITSKKTIIKNLGERKIKSPLPLSIVHGDGVGSFVKDASRIKYQAECNTGQKEYNDIFFEKAGARKHIFFEPQKTKVAIVTCGGLCPGLNNVIRSAYRQLQIYGVKDVIGIRFGFEGLNPEVGLAPIKITSEFVEDIHKEGGTVLGSSRGPQDVKVMVDFLISNNIDILICIGGDGTMHGASLIANEIKDRKALISVVGIPKTIDNDIMYISRSFGFNTAIEIAQYVLDCAHVEAKSARNGIGLVKVMGRESGFIAVEATLANQEVNFTLIPEVPFELYGEKGFLTLLKKRMLKKHHAVIVVAEGAGENIMPKETLGKDASGNLIHQDIGVFLKDQIKDFFKKENFPITLKYIDPSYIIRSIPANSDDSRLCDQLARRAVHGAMAGKTDMVIGRWNGYFVHVPIELAIEEKNKVDPESESWISVYEATEQPLKFL